MANVILFLEPDQAKTLLSLAGKGIGVFAKSIGTTSTDEDIAEFANAGAVYKKLSGEIEKAEQERLAAQQKKVESDRIFTELVTEDRHERTNPE